MNNNNTKMNNTITFDNIKIQEGNDVNNKMQDKHYHHFRKYR